MEGVIENISRDDIFRMVDLMFNDKHKLIEHQFKSYENMVENKILTHLVDVKHNVLTSIVDGLLRKYYIKISDIEIETPKCNKGKDLLLPMDARIYQYSYMLKIKGNVQYYYDVYQLKNLGQQEIIETIKLKESISKIDILSIPLMLQSKWCNLTTHKDIDYRECPYDLGGYFIIKGQEKVVIPNYRKVENKPLVSEDNKGQKMIEITSRSNIKVNSLMSRPQTMKIIFTHKDGIKLRLPILNKDINVFIMLRALGIESDLEILKYISYDMKNLKLINKLNDTVRNCKNDDDMYIYTSDEAKRYIHGVIKLKKKDDYESFRYRLDEILNDSILPHLSHQSLTSKGYYMCYLINKLVVAVINNKKDDRNSFLFKRVDLVGDLLAGRYHEAYDKAMTTIRIKVKGRVNDGKINDDLNMIALFSSSFSQIETDITKAMGTGKFGKLTGVSQPVKRLTYVYYLTMLRRIDITTSSTTQTKLKDPRELHMTSVGFVCPFQSPEHALIGLVHNLSLITTVTIDDVNSYFKVKQEIMSNLHFRLINNIDIENIFNYYKVFLNGEWLGIILNKPSLTNPLMQLYHSLMFKKNNGELSITTGIVLDHFNKEFRVYTDGGRLVRPILKVNENNVLVTKDDIKKITLESGEHKSGEHKINDWKKFIEYCGGKITYICIEEIQFVLIAEHIRDIFQMKKNMIDNREIAKNMNNRIETNKIVNRYDDNYYLKYDYCELHPSLLLGETLVNLPFCDHDNAPRVIYHFTQRKQAMGISYLSYSYRMDADAMLLLHPQKPLVNTESTRYVNTNVLPCGENSIVAIIIETGFSQEDALIFNKASIQRGKFSCIKFKKIEGEVKKNYITSDNDEFIKPNFNDVFGIKKDIYKKLNNEGYLNEGTTINNGDVIIGKVSPVNIQGSDKKYKDMSTYHKGDGYYVHTAKKFIGAQGNNQGYPNITMLLGKYMEPIIGDKFCFPSDIQTDVLTYCGWKNIIDVDLNDKIAILNDDSFTYAFPTKIQKYRYVGDIMVVRSNNIDVDVTIDHEMYVKKNNDCDYKLIAAKHIINDTVIYKKNGMYKDDHELCNDKIYIYHRIDILRVAAYFITSKETIVSCSSISHISESIIILHDVGLLEIVELMNDNVQIIFGKYMKTFLSSIWNINRIDSYYLLKCIFNDDDTFITYDKKLADNIQKLSIHAGISSTIDYMNVDSELYIIQLNIDINEPIVNHLESANVRRFEGNVSCLEVNTHVFMIRQNGKNLWIGNCTQHGGKGVIGNILEETDMPYNKFGIRPDILLNPNSIPKRMAIGQFLEGLLSKASALNGIGSDGTPFEDYDFEKVKDMLEKHGYNRNCDEYMMSGITGKRIKCAIFLGPVYYHRLKQLVEDKIHSRSSGNVTQLTRQPPEGRAKNGGLRIGEMERDAIIAQGMASFLNERLCKCSDTHITHVCGICGILAYRHKDRNSTEELSPNDVYYCHVCKNFNNIFKISIPYAAKLLVHNLMAMGIIIRFFFDEDGNYKSLSNEKK